ncbi:MAG: SHOCT domain-containing protein [Ruminococcaceae bacterium]|nr:SHOCT domain-containing protein [Oscillospiraceae bacterium]
MNADEILKLKKLLDEGVITQEEFEKEKSKYLNKNIKKKNNFGLIIGIICVFLICCIIVSTNTDTVDNQNDQTQETLIIQQTPEEFSSEIPISLSGKMYDNIIGVPELSLSITNNTDKNISAIKLYFSPRDVYGEDVTGIFVTNELYTDTTISARSSTTKAWQLLESTIKSGDVYVYSIYFEDGTEWGNKTAALSDIKKYGYKLKVKY